MSRIAVIQGHPDPAGGHFCHALAHAYTQGAIASGHEVREIEIARLVFPVLRTRDEWANTAPPAGIRRAQEAIAWAAHLVIVYPLWLGSMPALTKAFLEQVMRPGYAISAGAGEARWGALLKGRSARIVVTMGMPALVYRWYFRAHSLRSLERNILAFVGIRPIRDTVIGGVETCGETGRSRWLAKLEALGSAGA